MFRNKGIASECQLFWYNPWRGKRPFAVEQLMGEERPPYKELPGHTKPGSLLFRCDQAK